MLDPGECPRSGGPGPYPRPAAGRCGHSGLPSRVGLGARPAEPPVPSCRRGGLAGASRTAGSFLVAVTWEAERRAFSVIALITLLMKCLRNRNLGES